MNWLWISCTVPMDPIQLRRHPKYKWFITNFTSNQYLVVWLIWNFYANLIYDVNLSSNSFSSWLGINIFLNKYYFKVQEIKSFFGTVWVVYGSNCTIHLKPSMSKRSGMFLFWTSSIYYKSWSDQDILWLQAWHRSIQKIRNCAPITRLIKEDFLFLFNILK